MSARLPARLFLALLLGSTIVAATSAAVADSSSSVSPAPSASPIVVYMRNYQYLPASLTIKPGTTVTWRNDDTASHTATSTTGVFDSRNLDRGVVYSYTFTKPGKYSYTCSYHPYMTGLIIVTGPGDASAPAAPPATPVPTSIPTY